ncbi:hypothetical protein CYJ46_11310 [Corynebacterium coyleae]|uniref:hypothetical protein n=1 Tax=Corynebacterium coyleae TaxID=53374 RepID=UPI000C7792A8|nr:hypothetical protein [Corynebacterium coyleae]PLA36947.1 hypothetical protein CYJ46_11310 [Corynebacterium coyleae]
MSLTSETYYERQEFITELRLIDSIAASPSLSGALPSAKHPTPLRKVITPESLVISGLTVTAFARLDDFLSHLCRVYLNTTPIKNIKFYDLPAKMQSFLTTRQLDSFSAKARFRKDEAGNRINEAQKIKEALDFASKMALTPDGVVGSVSDFTFLPSGFDVSVEDVRAYLASFGQNLQQLERLLKSLSRRTADTPLKQTFGRIRGNRDTAAHDTNRSLAGTDLRTDIDSILDIAMGFEFLLAQSSWLAREGLPLDNDETPIEKVPFIAVQHEIQGKKHCLRHENFKNALSRETDLLDAYEAVMKRPKRYNGEGSHTPRAMLVLENDKVVDWVTWNDFH